VAGADGGADAVWWLLEASLGEARGLIERARRSARGRGAHAKLRAARALEELVERCGRVADSALGR
jgi:hypothetical protein